jgi:cell division protein FtsI (penicillin-binding protein 3)
VAAPAFREIAFNTLCYLKAAGVGKACDLPQQQVVAPHVTAQPAAEDAGGEGGSIDITGVGTAMPDFRGMSMRRVLQVMEKRELNLQLRGSGYVIEQHPLPGQVIRGTDEIWVRLTPSA